MSVWKEMRCDLNGPECYSNENNGPIGFWTDGAIRKEAQKLGWKRNGKLDYCPACSRPNEEAPLDGDDAS